MKNTPIKTTSRKTLLIAGLVATVLVVGSSLAYFLVNDSLRSIVGTDADYSQGQDADDSQNPAPVDNPEATPTPLPYPDTKTPQANDAGDNGNTSGGVNLTITAANQNEGTLQIRTQIDAVWNGTCYLNLTMGDKRVSREAGIQAMASTSTCQGFDVPVSELAPGEWNLEVSASHDDKKTATSQKITIK
ncbi:hypothetical protein JNJ66_07135 [Candidatus Saccharibacteria bacterium]|nr:hypothetical protein [Candidatus Saccharibacteria bacterium]